jgi:hypothetical protein
MLMVCHVACFLATFYREIFASKTDMIGQMMRISEILCIPIYISCILASIEHLCLITIRQMTLNSKTNLYLQGKLVDKIVKCSL